MWLARQGKDTFTKAEKAHSLGLCYKEVWFLAWGESLQLRIMKEREHMSEVSSAFAAVLLAQLYDWKWK